MSDLIDRQAFIENERKLYCEDCDRRKGTKNGKPNVICYEIGEAPCRACWLDDALTDLEDFPAASPWHRVEEELPKWVSVFDDLPRKNAVVVVSDGKRSWDVGQYHFLFKADDRTIWWWKKHTTRKVLWWMYKEDAIPEPPKEDA